MSDEQNVVESTETTQAVVAVSGTGSLSTMFPALFKDIDFETLNATIEALGNHSGNLEKDEKVAATEIVGSWQSNVTDKLKHHNADMLGIINFFKPEGSRNNYRYNYNYFEFSDDELTALSDATGTLELYNKAKLIKDELDALELTKPDRPFLSDDMSNLDRLKINNDYQYACTKYDVEKSKLERKYQLAWNEFLKKINEHSMVKDMIAKANKYTRNVDKLIDECNAKTNLAKLNIQINSQAVRDSLKALMDFTKTI